MDELSLLLLDPAAPLVTLTGTGGAGKTTLALAAARRTGSRFSDGVTVVWLAGISEEWQVLPELARVLEIEVAAQEPALQILTRALRSQQRLPLVLDDFRACDQSRARARAAGGWLPAAEGAGHQPRPLALVVGTRPQGRRSRCA